MTHPTDDGPALKPSDEARRRATGAATWTYEFDHGPAWYVKIEPRCPPPYPRQIHVEAIIDVAADGSLAGVEIIDSKCPGPTALEATPKNAGEAKPVSVQQYRFNELDGWHDGPAPPFATAKGQTRTLYTSPPAATDAAPPHVDLVAARAKALEDAAQQAERSHAPHVAKAIRALDLMAMIEPMPDAPEINPEAFERAYEFYRTISTAPVKRHVAMTIMAAWVATAGAKP